MLSNIINKVIFFLLLFISMNFSLLALQAQSVNDEDFEDEELLEEEGLDFKFSGQYKNLFVYQKQKNYYGNNILNYEDKKLYTDLNRIRLSPEIKYSEIFLLHVDYDNEVIYSNYNKSYQFDNYWRTSEYNDLVNLSYEPHYGNDVLYRTKFHRAYAKISISDLTITLGRQQIRFGSGKLWNPLDILNPVSPTFIESAEEQKGTDALRFDYYLNEFTELSLVYDQKRYNDKLSEIELENSNSVARLKTTIIDTDLAVLGGQVARRNVGGADFATILFDGILRGSAIYSKPENEDSYVQAGAGYDYSFKNSLSVLIEYFYNENNLNENDELSAAVQQSLVSGVTQENYFLLSNQFITYNKHYVGLALGYDLSSLLRADVLFIADVQGKGFFASPTLKFNIFENVDLIAGALLGYIDQESSKQSDFEEYEDSPIYYGSLQLFF